VARDLCVVFQHPSPDLGDPRLCSAFMVQSKPMPPQTRVNAGDSHAAGRARQHLKLAALGYVNARHGIDATDELVRAGLRLLCQKAWDYWVEAALGALPKNHRVDQGDSEMLKLAAIAYANARHGIDADVGMAREGMALLCQAAIDYVASLPKEDTPKRRSPLHLSNGA